MNLKLFLLTFVTVFLAELGDKTQIAAMGFAASNKTALWTVMLGASFALICSTVIGVLAGSYLATVVNPSTIRVGSGILFIIIGVGTLALPSIKKEFAYRKLIISIESYAQKENCRHCQKFHSTLSDIVKNDTKLSIPLGELKDNGDNCFNEPCDKDKKDCSADKLRQIATAVDLFKKS